MSAARPKGVLRPGWSASVEDYAIAGGWTRNGEALVVGDVAGGVYAFEGKSGASAWARQVRAYDADGREVWRFDDHPSTVSAIAWSSAGELAMACYGRVSFFDASIGELSQKLEWKGSLVSMVLSPDGDIVACGSQDNSVHFWRRSTEEDFMMSGYSGKPAVLADAGAELYWRPDGRALAALDARGGVTVWRTG